MGGIKGKAEEERLENGGGGEVKQRQAALWKLIRYDKWREENVQGYSSCMQMSV